jgi:hypothetical protein
MRALRYRVERLAHHTRCLVVKNATCEVRRYVNHRVPPREFATVRAHKRNVYQETAIGLATCRVSGCRHIIQEQPC